MKFDFPLIRFHWEDKAVPTLHPWNSSSSHALSSVFESSPKRRCGVQPHGRGQLRATPRKIELGGHPGEKTDELAGILGGNQGKLEKLTGSWQQSRGIGEIGGILGGNQAGEREREREVAPAEEKQAGEREGIDPSGGRQRETDLHRHCRQASSSPLGLLPLILSPAPPSCAAAPLLLPLEPPPLLLPIAPPVFCTSAFCSVAALHVFLFCCCYCLLCCCSHLFCSLFFLFSLLLFETSFWELRLG